MQRSTIYAFLRLTEQYSRRLAYLLNKSWKMSWMRLRARKAIWAWSNDSQLTEEQLNCSTQLLWSDDAGLLDDKISAPDVVEEER